MRWITDAAQQSCAPEPPDTGVAGLAVCLALLELEARALGRPLVATLLAAAGEELRKPTAVTGVTAPACPQPW